MQPGKVNKPSDLNAAQSAADKLRDLAKRMRDAAARQGRQGKGRQGQGRQGSGSNSSGDRLSEVR